MRASAAWAAEAIVRNETAALRSVKGKNPFKDIRVREAFYKAIDIELIKTRVMRGLSTPSALMIAPQLFKLSGDFTRPKLDPDGAKKLLTEAGVAVAPGVGFGEEGEGFVRLALVENEQRLRQAARGVKKMMTGTK